MRRFAQTYVRYSPLIQSVLGNISDIKATKEYSEAISKIKEAEDTRKQYDKFRTYSLALSNLDPNDKDFYNENKSININATGNEDEFYTNTLAGQKLMNVANEYNQVDEEGNNYKTDENGNKVYLKDNPSLLDLNEYLKDEALKQDAIDKGFYSSSLEPKTPEEIETLRFTKAGLDPKDSKWYKEFGTKFNADDYNRKLATLVLDSTPKLTSQGMYGNKYAELFGKRAGLLEITNPEYKFSANKDYILKYDDAGNYQVIPVLDPNANEKKKEEMMKLVNKQENWTPKQDFSGEWHWYARVYTPDEGFKELKMGKATEQEIQDYMNKLKKGELDTQYKELQIQKLLGTLSNTGKGGNSNNGRSGNRTGSNTKGDNNNSVMNGDEYEGVSEGDYDFAKKLTAVQNGMITPEEFSSTLNRFVNAGQITKEDAYLLIEEAKKGANYNQPITGKTSEIVKDISNKLIPRKKKNKNKSKGTQTLFE